MRTQCNERICDEIDKNDKPVIDLDFGDTLEILKGEYLDTYGVWSDILYATNFDKNSDLGTIYLDMVNMSRSDEKKAEEKFPISNQSYTTGNLLHGTRCQILLDTGAICLLHEKHIILGVNHYTHN